MRCILLILSENIITFHLNGPEASNVESLWNGIAANVTSHVQCQAMWLAYVMNNSMKWPSASRMHHINGKNWTTAPKHNGKPTIVRNLYSHTRKKNIQKVVTKKFCLLVKREVKSIVGLVVATCNIYTTCVRDLPHPTLAQVFVWHK